MPSDKQLLESRRHKALIVRNAVTVKRQKGIKVFSRDDPPTTLGMPANATVVTSGIPQM